ncbi:putative calmodulin [Plasmodium gaboni]|uniref:Calmodulin n=1 Tax=Plasmodium gaboni TaxID=647221 RepID=A0A151LL42_9APIC|nr:putative calmodulin [Plasmodium gaboni]KYN99688.1 putative calmodulin [Plasmodium gaboni]SOV15081.1 calmodulin, putative [Plasmodium gaboni]SOV23031.1 calmodulin, putative [Plasmodium sp. DRC-Itaito]
MQVNFPEDKIDLFEKNFNLIDNNNDKKISAEEFKILIRVLGQTISEKDLDEIINKHFEDGIDECVKDQKDNEEKNNKSFNNINKKVDIKNLISKINNIKNNEEKTQNNLIKNNYHLNEKIINKKHINFEQFLKIFMNIYSQPISLHELIKYFQIFDNENKGYMDIEKLKYMITNSDEKITEEDFKLFLDSINTKNKDKIDYVILSKMIKNLS